MPSEIKLYRRDGACSFVPHALLNELNIPFTSILMDWDKSGVFAAADGSFTNEEYKEKIHPSGYVPALTVDDQVIIELPAILTYIA